MTRPNVSRDDAMVDVYRDIMAMKHAAHPTAAVAPGAGVAPSKREVPGKRLRNWHRRYGRGLSLRAFARGLVSRSVTMVDHGNGVEESRVATLWLASKGARP